MSRLIKGDGVNRVVRGAVFEARADAERILAQAREQAEELRRAARAEADELRGEAREAGRAAGRAEVAALLLEAASRRDATLAEAETELLALAIAAAERVLRRQLSLEPERVREIVQGVLDRARRAKRGRLRVHPEDAPWVRELLSSRAAIELVEDPTLERAGCVFESDLGTIDGRLEVQLAELERALTSGAR